jgi:putative transposase
MARELGISRATRYYRRKLPERDEAPRRQIEQVMEGNPGYGSPQAALALKINERRAARVMCKFGLKPARRFKIPRKRQDQGRAPFSHPNILGRLCPVAPNVVWASDFTFMSYKGEFVYLCRVIDVFTREVLGFNISRTHEASFVRVAIERAVRKTATVPTQFHSDQGSEYASGGISAWLTKQGVAISMNPKGPL